jgi:deoxyribodipyrimidine photo-lyase
MLRSIVHRSPQAKIITSPKPFSTAKMAPSNILIYLMRRDLRLEDNPIFHELSKAKDSPYTHLLPLYVFPAQQVEVSGFIPKDGGKKSPYPEARSPVGGFWRCGTHRAKFLAESIWDLKEALEGVGSGLEIRVGMVGEVVNKLVEAFAKGEDGKMKVGAVWMTSEEGMEEKKEERDVKKICEVAGAEFKLFTDEKYFIDEYVKLRVYLHSLYYSLCLDPEIFCNEQS